MVDKYGSATLVEPDSGEYRVVEVSVPAKISVLSPRASYDLTVESSSPVRRSRSRSPVKSSLKSPLRDSMTLSEVPPPCIVPTNENTNKVQHQANVHLGNPSPIIINAEEDTQSAAPSPSRGGSGEGSVAVDESAEFTWKNPNEVLSFMKYTPDFEVKEVNDEGNSYEETNSLVLEVNSDLRGGELAQDDDGKRGELKETVLHTIKPGDVEAEETVASDEQVQIQAPIDVFVNALVAEVLSDDVTQTIMTKRRATPREASEDEKYARTISLLEKTAETQRLTALREKTLDEREANLVGLEKVLKNLLAKPLDTTTTAQKVMPGSPSKGSNPNSGSIQLQSNAGDSIKPMAMRLGQGKSAPPVTRGSAKSSSFLTSSKKSKNVDWSGANLAPGASFEAELRDTSDPVELGTDTQARATLVVPGEFNPDKAQEMKQQMQDEVAETLGLDIGSVVIEDIRKGSILFDILINGDGVQFSAREKMKDLHEICSTSEGSKDGGLLARVVGITDQRGNGMRPFRTNFSRLLRGGASYMNLPVKKKIIDPSLLMEIGAGGWQLKKDVTKKGRRRSYEAFEGEHEGLVGEMGLGSGSEIPKTEEVGRGSVDLSMVLEGAEEEERAEEEEGAEEAEGAEEEEKEGGEGGGEVKDSYIEAQKSKPILTVKRRKSTMSFDGDEGAVVKESSPISKTVPVLEPEQEPQMAKITSLPKRQKFDTNFGRFLKAGDKFVKEKLTPQKERQISLGKEVAKGSSSKVEILSSGAGGVEAKKEEGGSGSGNPGAAAASAASASKETAKAEAEARKEEEEEKKRLETKALVEGVKAKAIVKERDAAQRKVKEMERQLEETRTRLENAEVLLKKQQRSMSKPPKLISVAAEFPDADYSFTSSTSDTSYSTEEDDMGVGFGIDESREIRPMKPHRAWLQKTFQFYGDEVATGTRDIILTEEKGLDRRVEDSALERENFYRDNSEIFKGVAGVGLSVDDDDDEEEEEEEDKEREKFERELDGSLMRNPKVSAWIDKVQRMTSPGRKYKTRLEGGDRDKTPERAKGGGKVSRRGEDTSPRHHLFLDRVSGLLGEPSLSPKRKGRGDEEGSVRFSKMTVDLPSEDDENGSIRSLMTEEVYSPRTSYGGGKSVGGSKNYSFTRSLNMNSSVDSSMSFSGGSWVTKGGVVVARDDKKEEYYANRLDESFEARRRIAHREGSRVRLERGGRIEEGKWRKVYEEAEAGDSDYSSDEN
jgi:hypothetical protein